MFTDLTIIQGVIIGIILSVIAYLLDDLLILPMSNNTVATASDVVLAAVIYWAGVRVFNGTGLTFWEIIIFAAVVGVSEWFLHKYLARFVVRDKNEART